MSLAAEKSGGSGLSRFNTDALEASLANRAKDKEGCLSRLFTSKCIFYTYGFLDFVIFAGITTVALVGRKDDWAFILTPLVYSISTILLALVLCGDSYSTRYFYASWLRIKLVLQGIGLPIAVFIYVESHWESEICSQVYPEYGDYEYFRAIINNKNFTLLASTDGLQQSSLNV